jgi:hypothetical protein
MDPKRIFFSRSGGNICQRQKSLHCHHPGNTPSVYPIRDIVGVHNPQPSGRNKKLPHGITIMREDMPGNSEYGLESRNRF